MAERSEVLTYKQNMSRAETFRIMKAVGVPLAVFGFGMFTISTFSNFGTKLICPLSGAMWFFGFFVALLMPSQRQEVLHQTLGFVAGYYAALLGIKILLGVVSGVSSEMIAASYDQAIPTSTGNAMPGYLQTFMWFTAVLTPIGFMGMQAKRLRDFKHNQTLYKTFGQKRGIRNTEKKNSRSI